MSDHISIVTPHRNLHLGDVANATTVASQPNVNKATATRPTTNLTAGRIVIPGVTNYLKFMPIFESGTTSPIVHVHLWSYLPDLGVWVSASTARLQTISSLSATKTATVNGTDMFPPAAVATVGDIKSLWNSSTLGNAAFIVDGTGAELIEITFSSSTTTKLANVIWSSI